MLCTFHSARSTDSSSRTYTATHHVLHRLHRHTHDVRISIVKTTPPQLQLQLQLFIQQDLKNNLSRRPSNESYNTSSAPNPSVVHRSICELADELAIAVGAELTKARTEIDAMCAVLGLKNFEAELERRLSGVKQDVMNDCTAQWLPPLEPNMVMNARFSELGKADRD
jgi:hypothetical protein